VSGIGEEAGGEGERVGDKDEDAADADDEDAVVVVSCAHVGVGRSVSVLGHRPLFSNCTCMECAS
jgi:hypothetical protein